jgi:hypothetical protein
MERLAVFSGAPRTGCATKENHAWTSVSLVMTKESDALLPAAAPLIVQKSKRHPLCGAALTVIAWLAANT